LFYHRGFLGDGEKMPANFEKCVREGGRVRRKMLSDGRYINICYPKGGGPGKAGEVHQKVGEKFRQALGGEK